MKSLSLKAARTNGRMPFALHSLVQSPKPVSEDRGHVAYTQHSKCGTNTRGKSNILVPLRIVAVHVEGSVALYMIRIPSNHMRNITVDYLYSIPYLIHMHLHVFVTYIYTAIFPLYPLRCEAIGHRFWSREPLVIIEISGFFFHNTLLGFPHLVKHVMFKQRTISLTSTLYVSWCDFQRLSSVYLVHR